MKIGDYVRTKDGKIFKWNILCKIKQEWSEEYINEYTRFCYIDKNEIIKSSPNIIDLIEVGDIIKGIGNMIFSVIDIDYENKIISGIDFWCEEKDIKSIVTKEQFKSMEYKVKE